MALYTNMTRFPAIVTLKIESVVKSKAAIKIGVDGASEELESAPGYYDFFVGAGKEIHLINDTVATLIAVRSAP